MKHLFYLLLLAGAMASCVATTGKQPVEYVNPFIGTDGDGHTFPGALVPFGMVQLSPDNGDNGYNWCSGYHYSSDSIYGFSHTHYSGTGAENLSDISLMPMADAAFPAKGVRSAFSHDEETARPGYYAVRLQTFDIGVELTATSHCGLHRYTFPGTAAPSLRIDLGRGNGAEARVGHNGDLPLECTFERVNDSTVVGVRRSIGFVGERVVWFAARTNRPFTSLALFAEDEPLEGDRVTAVRVKGFLSFPPAQKDDRLLVKVAISSADREGALAGLEEIEGWDFDRVARQASIAWAEELDKITVTSPDEAFKESFYTAIYHNYFAPFRFDDATGRYRGADRQIHNGRNIYTLHSLWDTFRATAPLYTLTQTDRLPHIINSYLEFYRQHGLLPSWELYFNEANVMPGYHAVPIIADAILKGVGGFDYDFALEAMVNTANEDIRECDYYRQYGYVPDDLDPRHRGATKTVEYAFDDWCIAQVARKLGKRQWEEEFTRRSGYWKNLFDPSVGFIRSKDSAGRWMEPFDPENDFGFQEGNSWIYTWYVPHDVPGLVKAMGGAEVFEQKLDSLYNGPSKPYRDLVNHGFYGLSEFSNEPSHHVPYLYAYIGKPWKTAEKVHHILTQFYHNTPTGLCGNDDCGQTSAWYVLSSLGFYPVNPTGGEYVLGTPLAQQSVIRLANGKTFTITARNHGPQNIYITGATLNGKPHLRPFLSQAEIERGGELVLSMDSTPNKQWGN